MRQMARALSRSADGYLYALVPALLWLSGGAGVDSLIVLLLCSLAMERSLYWLLKNGLRRRRPQDLILDFRGLIQAAEKFSFPSGGSVQPRSCWPRPRAIVYQNPALPMYAWATMIAFSRVILGVHYPGDNLAGAVMGGGIALFTARQPGI